MDKKQTKVKVVIRVRPALKEDAKLCVNASENAVEIFNHRNINENIKYEFSQVYDSTCSQQSIYNDCVKGLLHRSLAGENVSIFAYGPTGAGKTHTMLGSPNDPGIIPRVINGLFQTIDSQSKTETDSHTTDVVFSYLEIYNEKVQDLLEPRGMDLPIREDGHHNIFVTGLAEKNIKNFDEFKNLFGPASNNRTVAATKLNDRSSRSHSILMLKVRKKQQSAPYREYQGKIYLIDLAGSEDNRRTGNKGIRLKESGAINKSLFSLGEVVDAINTGLPRIPYRNSKLTRLLQDSIGGSCHSIMITNIAPEEHYYYDTYCTLNFASKSKKIVNTNTSCIRETPVTTLSHPKMKRSNSDIVNGDRKRPRLSPPSPRHSAEPPVSTDPAPLLSPLLRRQQTLEQTVNSRLQEMEQNILRHIQQANNPALVAPGNVNMETIQKQLSVFQDQLKQLGQQGISASQSEDNASQAVVDARVNTTQSGDNKHQPEVGSSQPVNSEKKKKAPVKKKLLAENGVLYKSEDKKESKKSDATVTEEKVKERRPMKDTTNQRLHGSQSSKRPSLKDIDDDITCSPLFLAQPRLFKKGFRSTGSKKCLLEVDDEAENRKQDKLASTHLLNSSAQRRHNSDFLSLLNTSSVKELQQLHTVGNKRARLIYEWRELHGQFVKIEDIKNIPGFTEKYLQNLLHSNMVSIDL